jgi:hypothetical protein
VLVRIWGKRNLNPLKVGMQLLWKNIWRFLKNPNIDLPYYPAIPFLGIYPKECNTGYSRGTCTPYLLQHYSQ